MGTDLARPVSVRDECPLTISCRLFGGTNASGISSRIWRSPFPSCLAISDTLAPSTSAPTHRFALAMAVRIAAFGLVWAFAAIAHLAQHRCSKPCVKFLQSPIGQDMNHRCLPGLRIFGIPIVSKPALNHISSKPLETVSRIADRVAGHQALGQICDKSTSSAPSRD